MVTRRKGAQGEGGSAARGWKCRAAPKSSVSARTTEKIENCRARNANSEGMMVGQLLVAGLSQVKAAT
eukprot:3085469-Pleurochrysis_carterae.AAC.2